MQKKQSRRSILRATAVTATGFGALGTAGSSEASDTVRRKVTLTETEGVTTYYNLQFLADNVIKTGDIENSDSVYHRRSFYYLTGYLNNGTDTYYVEQDGSTPLLSFAEFNDTEGGGGATVHVDIEAGVGGPAWRDIEVVGERNYDTPDAEWFIYSNYDVKEEDGYAALEHNDEVNPSENEIHSYVDGYADYFEINYEVNSLIVSPNDRTTKMDIYADTD